MKKNILRVVLITLLLMTFGVIFGFSSQDEEQSGGLSQGITQRLTSKIKFIQEKDEAERLEIIDRIESVIRKVAHFSIYTVVRNFADGISIYI